jgi:hypothetical protein
VAALGGADAAVILGDLNDVPGSPMYEVITGAGFLDVWGEVHETRSGFTCCHAPDLSNGTALGLLAQRIDYVMVRGAESHKGRLAGFAELLGEVPGDRVRGPEYRIWPSDHAGVVARVLFDRNP